LLDDKNLFYYSLFKTTISVFLNDSNNSTLTARQKANQLANAPTTNNNVQSNAWQQHGSCLGLFLIIIVV